MLRRGARARKRYVPTYLFLRVEGSRFPLDTRDCLRPLVWQGTARVTQKAFDLTLISLRADACVPERSRQEFELP